MESKCRFTGIELNESTIPDESSILNSRHLLERYSLTEAIFSAVKAMLNEYGLLVRGGTLVDAMSSAMNLVSCSVHP